MFNCDKTRIAQIFLLFIAGLALFLLYSNALNCGFVLDDKNNIEFNHHIRITTLSVDAIAEAATESVLKRRPVAYISFALNYFFHGLNVKGFHLTNIFLHLGTGILLYFLTYSILEIPKVRKKYGPPGWIPLATAIIWLVHPAQTQTVNYIVQRMTILAALFYVMSFFFYIKGRTAEKIGPRWMYLGGSLVAGLLGLGSKETVAMLPVFLILFELYFFQDFKKPQSAKIIASLTLLLLLFCLLFFFYLGKNPLTYIMNSYGSRDFTRGQRVLTQSRVVLFYLSLIFLPLPARLNLEHDFPVSMSLLDPLSTLLASSVIIMVIILAFISSRKTPLVSFCLLWYFGNLLMESSVIGLEIIFEHRVYLPSMLVILLMVLWLQKVLQAKWLQIAALGAVLSCLLFLTYDRNTAWTDTLSLMTDSAAKSPQKARPHLNLGIVLKNKLYVDEAISHYHQALAIDPNYAEAYYNLGNAMILKNNFKAATEYFYKALKLTPKDVDTHYNLGYTLAKIWQFDKAIYHYSEAIRLKPDFMKAREELFELKQYIKKLYKNKKPS